MYVSAVDRLRGLESYRWVPGRVLSRSGVKFTIELSDGRIIVRHADQVRERLGAEPVPGIPNSGIPFSRPAPVMPPCVPVPVPPVPVPAVAPVPAVPAAAEPSSPRRRSPPAPEPVERPAADSAGAAAPVPDPPDPPRYNLRNRASLRPPDRY